MIDDNPHADLARTWAKTTNASIGSVHVTSSAPPHVLFVVEVPLAKCDANQGRDLEAAASKVWDAWEAAVQTEEQILVGHLRNWGLEPDTADLTAPADHPSGWVSFHGDDVSGRVYRTGEQLARVRVMYVLDPSPNEDTARSWMARPREGGMGRIELEQVDDEPPYLRLVDELPYDDPRQRGRRLRDRAAKLWWSWYEFSLTEVLPPPDLSWEQALTQAPRSAWLLLGDEASYPSADALARQTAAAERGVFDVWTASPQTQPGDLLLFYFTGKRKAVHFAARAVSYAHFRGDISVNATTEVNDHQWWVRVSPMIELNSIPLDSLREAFNGHLMLKGRSGRYIPTAAVSQILAQARARRPREGRRMLKPVRASVALPRTLSRWRDFTAGELTLTGRRVLEARIEEHIVNPLLSLACITFYQQQYRVGRGFADYVVQDSGLPASVIEVKVRVKEPLHAPWVTSPDFAQVMRYSHALGGCPAMLIDSHRVFLIGPGDDSPSRIIERARANRNDLKDIRSHLLGH
ncbi:hypothetical protein [Terrabacter ginsenosidimutans]|uniref:hypothetical protein n=1 Tax=Terrabacter ginsenosidimutans TaxID=490575 RepID=UPI0031E57A95